MGKPIYPISHMYIYTWLKRLPVAIVMDMILPDLTTPQVRMLCHSRTLKKRSHGAGGWLGGRAGMQYYVI